MPDQTTPSSDSPPPPRTRETVHLFEDLTSDLLWPKLLRAPALALSPSRLALGIVAAFVLTILARVPTLWIEDPPRIFFSSSLNTEPSLNPLRAFESITDFLGNIFYAGYTHPWTTLIVGVPMIFILSLLGCIMSRTAAIEFAQGRIADRSDTTAFVLRRATHLGTAVFGPIVLSFILIGIIALGGFLLSVPVVDLLGGVLYSLGLVLGVIVFLTLVMQLLSVPLIVPSIACEGTDGFDAIQRSYAYIAGRPLRVLGYATILFVLGTLALGVFQLVMHGSIALTDWSMELLANDAGVRVLTSSEDLGATQPAAHNFIEFWRALFQLIFAGYAISYLYTASTMLYLVIRRVCDGQDLAEIWVDPTN
ncbi:MAG: hypothetical protein JKY96_03355 [Phycisphaerales bacterium]|nr:hypothetical protein [Phycisphaerales bacterium]